MSCEVAVMNKRGVALAADSAVTMGGGKIYHAAEKLFQLSDAPIGILTYGSADIMGVPWETVVKMFGRKLANRRFDSVAEYGQEFIRFIEGSNSLFPESAQIRWFQSRVGNYWKSSFADRLQEKSNADPKAASKHAGARLSAFVSRDIVQYWNEYDSIEGLDVGYGEKVIAEYAAQIEELEKQLFAHGDLSVKTKRDLRTIVQYMYTKKWIDPEELSGVVVAGMGESEPFPVLIHYHVGSIAAGRLHFYKVNEARVTHDDGGGWVVPFAQKEKINLFYRGIFQELEQSIPELSLQSLNEVLGPSAKKLSAKLTEKFTQALSQKLDRVVCENYRDPLLESVSGLPRYELAKLAEALVNLTAFQKRMSTDEDESVGGWVDVAVISKGDGFIWAKKRNFKTDFGDSDAAL